MPVAYCGPDHERTGPYPGLEAHALGIAHEFDPYFGLSISRVDPLPHQCNPFGVNRREATRMLCGR